MFPLTREKQCRDCAAMQKSTADGGPPAVLLKTGVFRRASGGAGCLRATLPVAFDAEALDERQEGIRLAG